MQLALFPAMRVLCFQKDLSNGVQEDKTIPFMLLDFMQRLLDKGCLSACICVTLLVKK